MSLPAINNNNSNTRIVIPPIKSFTTHQPIQQFPSQEKVNYNPVQPAPRVSLQKVEKDNFNQTQPETINSTAKQTVPPSVNPPPVAQTAKGTYKIVCVDDSPAILQELNRCLEDELFSVSTISNPVKALMQIIKIKPDLILLDVNMAGIDGYELCRLLRNHSLFKNIPIIMVTGNTGIINRVKAKIVGASGYITKPFTQSDLLKIVFRHLS